jgi:hypothetical protein
MQKEEIFHADSLLDQSLKRRVQASYAFAVARTSNA